MLIGREDELQFLEDKYKSADSQIVVLYGKRRLGKTAILREFCEDKTHIFYSCTKSVHYTQLKLFSECLKSKIAPNSRIFKPFNSWQEAFENLAALPCSPREKKLVIIDEFHLMFESHEQMPFVLQHVWEETLRKKNIMIILCSSLTIFVEKIVLNQSNPFLKYVTGVLKLNKLSFFDAVKFFPNYSVHDKITAYAVFGGTPYYLSQMDPNLSLSENIVKKILTRSTILYHEVDTMIRSDIRESANLNPIVHAIASGSVNVKEIYEKTADDRNRISMYIKTLMDMDIVMRENMLSAVAGEDDPQRGTYIVADNFICFWYAFVYPNFSALESGDPQAVFDNVISPELDKYTARIFDDICRQYLIRENEKGNLPFTFSRIGQWRDFSSDLDVMATDDKKDFILIGDCQYNNAPVSVERLYYLCDRVEQFKTKSTVFYCLFTKREFSDEIKRLYKNKKLLAITAEDILKQE